MTGIIGLLVFVGLIVLGIRLHHIYLERKYRRKVSLDVRKRLITAENYSALDNSTLLLMKNDIFNRHMRALLICLPFMAIILLIAALKHSEPIVYLSIVLAFTFIGSLIIVKYLTEISRLSSAKEFVKIKGFIFREVVGHEYSVMYYDMVKLDYRVFRQDIFLHQAQSAHLGEFVTLIGVRTPKKVKIVRILTF